jgi:uncharacterized membrane protein
MPHPQHPLPIVQLLVKVFVPVKTFFSTMLDSPLALMPMLDNAIAILMTVPYLLAILLS